MAEHAAPVAVAPVGYFFLQIHISFSLNHVGVTKLLWISEKKAADTGSLLTHFICLALGLLTMKQMENNCIISRVERLLTGYLFHMQFVEFLPVFSAHAR